MASIVIPPSLNFKTVEKASPMYTYKKIPMFTNPSGGFNLDFVTQSIVDFQLPNNCVNLARSYLGYTNSFAIEAGKAIYVPEDTTDLGISNLSLTVGTGFDLCNLNYVTNFLKIATKLGTSIKELADNGPLGDGLFNNNKCGWVNNYPAPFTPPANNVFGYGTVAQIGAVNGLSEVQYLSNGADGSALVKCRQFPLSWFKDTIFSVDKSIFLGGGGDAMIKMMVGGPKVGFGADDATTPAVGAIALTGGNSVIKDMYLYLCIENNPEVIANIMEKYNQNKLSYMIPYSVGIKTSLTINTVNNVTIQVTKNYGKYLKKIVHTIFNADETKNLGFDMSNFNGSKTVSYNTSLDTVQLQPMILSCLQPTASSVNATDWAYNKKICHNSAITGYGQYENNWFHCDQFFDDSQADRLDGNNLEQGLPMHDNHRWDFSGVNNTTVPAGMALNNYTFLTFSREVLVSPNGLSNVNF